MALSPNGKTVASGSYDGIVRVWDLETEKVIAKWTASARVLSVYWSADGNHVLTGSYGGLVSVWDVKSRETVLGIETGHKEVYAVIYSPDETKIATGGSEEDAVKIWDAKLIGKLLYALKHNSVVYSLAWTSNQLKLISASSSIKIFDTTTWQQTAILEGHESAVHAISLFQNNRLLASASWDQTTRLWDLDTNLQIGPSIQHEALVNSTAISADGKLLVTACWDNNAYVWDIYTILKVAGLRELLSIPSVPQDGTQQNALARKSLMNTDAWQRPAQLKHAHQLPQGFFDSTRDGVHSSAIRDPHLHASTRRLALSSPSLQRRTQIDALPDHSLRAVEVAAVRDKQALYVAPPRESLSEKAKRIKNPTWWIRCVLFIICVSPPNTASPDTTPPPNT
ncbi:WD40 repeat-like protein [Rhizopogon salebrosus TDB-379]|nr:WD40 repeat-like protein [Rhizopogon salebrosus TDB-379]